MSKRQGRECYIGRALCPADHSQHSSEHKAGGSRPFLVLEGKTLPLDAIALTASESTLSLPEGRYK